jgi:NAD(P)-dependent dehydrogenase (short-subunit alcohol dehydrogenase family)
MDAEPRKVVVVGAGSGIGAATAAHFFGRGDHVLAVDLRASETPASQHLQCDLRNAEEIGALLDRIGEGWDALAHVAGVPGTAPPDDVLRVNYLGMRLMTEGMLPRLRRGGSVVAVASTAAVGWQLRTDVLDGLLAARDVATVQAWQAAQDPAYPVYSTSKQAVILCAKRLSGPAWSRFGVRVNTVSPGPVQTPILADFEQSMGADVLDAVRSAVGRHGTVDDVVPLISFLTSPEARWINGQDIQADAGYLAGLLAGAPIQV